MTDTLPIFRPAMASVSGRVNQATADAWTNYSEKKMISIQVLLEFIGAKIETVLTEDEVRAAQEETHRRNRRGGPKRKKS